jgi:inorganic pyrophosphatase
MENLPSFDSKTGELNAIVDTPKGSRNKFKYDEDKGMFKLGGVLLLGACFPFDFGYGPATKGGDGDAGRADPYG